MKYCTYHGTYMYDQIPSMQNLALARLPVRARIHFRIALWIFKSITTYRPTYQSDLHQFRTSSRHIRSIDRCLLNDTVFGSRSFCHADPTVWNSLSADIRPTDNFNNKLLSGYKWCRKRILQTFIRDLVPVVRFFYWQWHHSASRVPRVRLSTYGGRAFCYAGPSAWNAVPDFLKKTVHFLYPLLDVSWNIFTSHSTSTPSAFEVFFTVNALYKFLTYLLT